MSTYLGPVQGNPLRRACLVIARLKHLWPWLGAGGIIQGLLLSGRDLTLAEDTARADTLIAASAAFGPVPNHPAGDREKSKACKGHEGDKCNPSRAAPDSVTPMDCSRGLLT